MEQLGKAMHEFMGTEPGETPQSYAKETREDEKDVYQHHRQLREASTMWAVWCLWNLEGTALALGLNLAHDICVFLNHLEGKGKAGDRGAR